MDYIEVTFTIFPKQPWTDLLTSELAEIGYDSFVENESGTSAYIPKKDFSESAIQEVTVFQIPDVKVSFETKEIASQNWNATWESNFEPIEINESCWIRAPFHTMASRPNDVLISPQMAFGTGHHETTFLVSKNMFDIDLKDKSVLDMGCGTGVLAILAENLGAKPIVAIDIDAFACDNTLVNVGLNHAKHILVEKGGAEQIGDRKFDVIFANINKNILKKDMETYTNALQINGIIMFSGFFKTDVEEITQCATKYGLQFVNSEFKNDWAMTQFKKS